MRTRVAFASALAFSSCANMCACVCVYVSMRIARLTLFLGRTEVQLLEEVTQPFGRNYGAAGFGTPCV